MADFYIFKWLRRFYDMKVMRFRFSVCMNECVCSAGKESACNAGDPSSIPGSGSCPGKACLLIGYPLLFSWASLVAQMIKNLPAMRETQIQPLGQEDTLEKGMAIHSSIGQRSLESYSPWSHKESDTTEQLTHTHTHTHTHTF